MDISILDYEEDQYYVMVSFDAKPTSVTMDFTLSDLQQLEEVLFYAKKKLAELTAKNKPKEEPLTT